MKTLLDILFITFGMLLGFTIYSHAQVRPIHDLRYNDNFSYLLSDTVQKKGTDHLKWMPISKGGNTKWSLGGEVREWYEYRKNSNFGDVPPGMITDYDGSLQHRLMLHADLQVNTRIRVFGQLNNTLELGNPNPPVPEIIVDGLGLHQFFLDLNVGKKGNEKGRIIRIGRQELDFGNGLLISSREGPNNRQAFDGISYIAKNKNIDLHALFATPVIIHPEVFDNSHINEFIWGAYASFRKLKPLKLDLYYFGFYSERRQFNYVSGKQNRHTIGGRLWQRGRRLWVDTDMMYQTGTFNDLMVHAFNATAEVHYFFPDVFLKPMIGLGASYVSGDYDPNDKQLNTFDPMYPKPVYGLAMAQGPSNITHIKPTFGLQPLERLYINFSWYYLARTSNKDGSYAPSMVQVRPSSETQSDQYGVGIQYGLDIFYIINQHFTLMSFNSYVTPGSYVKETGMGKPITFSAVALQYKF
ncbi:alginate export family protein [Flammeovirga sp. OC4]|uniref:alginate export family protein n=1 Tax=Flammeovirga sp. OC4 TaxID=1382345 RepID=UPI0009E3C631|nr:alginate export family protein [Flammeovirga sp. OC4]